MLRGLIIIALILFAAAASGVIASYFGTEAEPGPIEIAERIRARACGGETLGFNSYIDKAAVEHAVKRSELVRLRKEFVYSTQKRPGGNKNVREYILNSVPELLEVKWQLYDGQVRAGEAGPICNMDIIRAGEAQSTVKLKFPGGERSTWGFGKVGDEWKIVSIIDVRPLTLLASNKSLVSAAKTKRKPKDAPAAEAALEKTKEPGTEKAVSDVPPEEVSSEPDVRAEPDDTVEEPDKLPESEEVELEAVPEVSEPEETVEIAAAGYGSDFRSTSWGMTQAQVKAAEGEEPGGKAPGVLTYDTYFKGESVKVRYKFSEGRLKSGGVIFLNEHPEEIFYVQDFERRRGELTQKYGEPVINEEIWYNRLYEGMPEKMGFAVAIGHLKLRTKWRTGRSDILLELKSEDYDMTLVLSYHSR